jgi:hypothetical protein
MAEVMPKRRTVLVVVALSLAMAACGLNSNLPEYGKDFVAYKEDPDGLVIYFILADASGIPTTAGGKVAVSIVEETHRPDNCVCLGCRGPTTACGSPADMARRSSGPRKRDGITLHAYSPSCSLVGY